MIIKGHGISSSSNISKFNSYLFDNEKNEEIHALQGSKEDIKNMFADANNLKNGCYHFIMSSKETLTKEQALKVCSDISKEYGQNPKDAVIINHQKQRNTNDSDNNHYHIILQSADTKTGKAIDYSFSKKRNEKISRLAELELGQNLIKGRHNTAVFHQLLKEGKKEQAEQMKHLTQGDLPNSSYTSKGLEKCRRLGLDKAQETQAVKDIWKACDSLKAFKNGLSEQGYELKPGEKPGIYIIEKNGLLVGSANRLTNMKKEEFQEKYKKEINENVQPISEKRTTPKRRFKEEGEAKNPEEPNPAQSTGTTLRTQETGPKLRKRFNQSQSENTSEYRQNLKSSGNYRDRRKPIVVGFGRNQKQPNIDIRRNEQLKREIKKLERRLKWESKINSQINKYEHKKQEKRSKELQKEISDYEIIQKIIDELCNRLFGTPTQKQKDVVHNLIMNSHKNKDLLNHIVNSELSEISFPKSLSEEKLKNIPESQKIKEVSNIKKIYSSQKNFINDLNKKYNLNLPNPSFSELLNNHQERNFLCKSMLENEIKKENIENSLNKIQRYIDKCEENIKLKHDITDIETIRKNISDNLFSSYKSSMNDYNKIEKEFNDINIKFLDKYFNKEKINQKNSLSEKLNNLKDEMNKKEDKYNHFTNFENEISKAESDRRIKENDEIKKDWKYKKSLENLPILKNIQFKISQNDENLIDKINNGELKNILSDEIQKMKEIQKLEQKKDTEQKENNIEPVNNVIIFKR